MIAIKRAYRPPTDSDGYRVLVDRLWPRGKKREDLRIDEWKPVVAPSSELRKWFGHRAERWTEFKSRYRLELGRPEAVAELVKLYGLSRSGMVTLVFSAKDEMRNNAIVLQQVLGEMHSKAIK